MAAVRENSLAECATSDTHAPMRSLMRSNGSGRTEFALTITLLVFPFALIEGIEPVAAIVMLEGLDFLTKSIALKAYVFRLAG